MKNWKCHVEHFYIIPFQNGSPAKEHFVLNLTKCNITQGSPGQKKSELFNNFFLTNNSNKVKLEKS